MANYVYNSVSISTETKEQLDQLMLDLAKPYNFTSKVYLEPRVSSKSEYRTEERKSEFSFNNIIPAPVGTPEYDEYELPGGATSQKWYDWNVKNWDTKWDAADVAVNRLDNTQVVYSFSTAWSPPVAVITKLAQLYPNFEISFGFEEEQGWGAEMESPRGDSKLHETKSWDIPASHADYKALDRECNCEFEDDKDYWFADCPTQENN